MKIKVTSAKHDQMSVYLGYDLKRNTGLQIS